MERLGMRLLFLFGSFLLFSSIQLCLGGSGGPVTAEVAQNSSYSWKPHRPLNTWRRVQMRIRGHTCARQQKEFLRLPRGLISQIPQFNRLPTTLIHPNRSDLVHVHNMAMSRAFFHSYVLQYFNVSRSDFIHLPGLLYLYLSAVADVSANPLVINGSTILYDVHKFYPNWFTTFLFNTTFNLFGVRAMRVDDTFQTENFLREPTMRTIRVTDLGAMEENYTHTSYRFAPWYGKGDSDPGYIPDDTRNEVTGGKKQSYRLTIHWDPKNRTSNNFFGPPYAGELENEFLPVRFTEPWFDCGKVGEALNEWIVSATSPVVDFMPRYGTSVRLLKPEYVAVTAMDTFFVGIPVNLCPISQGNPEPNLVAGSDHCTETMTCEPMFKPRGGVVSQFTASTFYCRCKIGYRYPVYQPGPYPGSELGKKTTREEKAAGYQCVPIERKMVWPTELGLNHIGKNKGSVQLTRRKRSLEANGDEATVTDESEEDANDIQEDKEEEQRLERMKSMENKETMREWFEARNMSLSEFKNSEVDFDDDWSDNVHTEETKKRKWVPRFDPNWLPQPDKQPPHLHSRHRRDMKTEKVGMNKEASDRVDQLLAFVDAVTPTTCRDYHPDQLVLQGGVSFGADQQFSGEASTALRLAHFLSAFMQNNEGAGAIVGDYRIGQDLHEYHLFGELLANVAGSMHIVSSGIFFERNKFINSKGDRLESFGPLMYRDGELKANSFAARDTTKFGYGYANEDWYRVLHDRWASNTYHLEKIRILPWIRPSSKVKYTKEFVKYPLYFRAPRLEDGYWTQPYYDCNGPVPEWLITYSAPFFGMTAGKLDFRGVVTVSVPLRRLHINQCPAAFHESNFFQNSALCDSDSTTCKHVWGHGFKRGNYECHCGPGFEFPFLGRRFFYLGQRMEENFRKKSRGEPNLFDLFKCRQSGGSNLSKSAFSLLFAFGLVRLFRYMLVGTL